MLMTWKNVGITALASGVLLQGLGHGKRKMVGLKHARAGS